MSTTATTKQGRRPIVFEDIDSDDFQAVLFAEMGLSNNFIHKHTGLSHGQIGYRTRQAQVFRRDYRDGTNDMAKRAINKVGMLLSRREQVEKGDTFARLRQKALERERKSREAVSESLHKKVKKALRAKKS